MLRSISAFIATAALACGPVMAAPMLMSGDWAKDACNAWNQDPRLTEDLKQSGWSANHDKERGFKIMQLYRNECRNTPRAEMHIAEKDGLATCVFGGKATTDKLNDSADYVMHADTARWIEMGKGDYGPMRAMMFGRLQFEGPKGEAMRNMGPFERFLLLVGKVDGDASACPE